MSEVSSDIAVPGQMVLNGFEEVMRIESARLSKIEHENFCWAFVTNGGKAGPAYLATIDGTKPLLRAQKNASDMLKKPEIAGRIKEIASIIQRKYEHEVIAHSIRALNLDPGKFFDEHGNPRRLHTLQEGERKGIGLEAKIVDGNLHYIPVFPSPEKARDALQKMFGMNVERSVVTGANGGPQQHEHVVAVADSSDKLDEFRERFRKYAEPAAG